MGDISSGDLCTLSAGNGAGGLRECLMFEAEEDGFTSDVLG